MRKYFFIPIVFVVLSLFISVNTAYAENQQELEIEIKYTNGDIADFNSMKILVYQDFEKEVFLEKKMTGNPEFITVPENHRYKVEVYSDGMYGDVGYVEVGTSSEKLEIDIPLSGGLQFNVFYKNGEIPIEGATVVLKLQDNSELRRALTNDEGNTIRYWIQSTHFEGDYYIADVYLDDLFLTSHFPIKLLPGIATDEKIITQLPDKIEELVTINLFSGTKKITSDEGNYEIKLQKIDGDIITSSNVNFRGDAQFDNLNTGTYVVKVKSPSNFENLLWPKTTIHVTGDTNDFNIFKNQNNFDLQGNPLLSCNCISFRLDDVQDHWLADTQIEIIELFAEKNIPLSVGVIGKLIGTDEELVSIIKNNLDQDNIEIVNHSWDNEPLINLNDNTQKENILNTNDKIQELFDYKPKIFVPPQNLYDSTTIEILKENDFSYLISHVDDNDATFIDQDLFYNIPATTETGILLDSTQWKLHENEYVKNKITENLETKGYSIIMIHPQEFSLNSEGEYDSPNSDSIQRLSQLLDEINKMDANIVKISDIEPTEVIIEEDFKKEDLLEACNCVAFRLDGVQDYWLNQVQMEIIESFIQKNKPLTLGIIANAFGNDPTITEYVKKNLENNKSQLEIATKGIGLTPFTNYDKNEQNENLKESIEMIKLSTDSTPKIFIPPDNKFNSDTLDILEENNITHISASLVNGDSPPFYFSGDEIFRYPQTVSTGKFVPSKNIFETIENSKIISETIQSINNYGFAVISIQPQEFSTVENSTYVNSPNEKQIQNLKKLIQQIDSKGFKIVSIGEINSSKIISVPEWIKNNAGWWADGTIDDKTFVQGIEYLVKESIIKVTVNSEHENTGESVPKWIKNNAGWWADGTIDDKTFVQGIEYLVKNGIISY